MDKHRRYKKHHHRFNPLGNTEPDVVDFGGNQNQDNDDDYVDEVPNASLTQKINSFDPTIREMATISLAQVEGFSDDILKELNNEGVFQILIQRLVDPNPQIVLNSIMALMNIIECNGNIDGKSVSYTILQKGLVSVLESILSGFKEAHENKSIDANESNFATKLAVIDNIYRLLSTLAEVIDQDLISKLLQSNSTQIGLYFINNTDEPKILTGIASYLHVLTEISADLCQQMSQNINFLKRLLDLLDKQFSTQELKAYILGTLYNYIRTSEKHQIQVPDKTQLAQKIMTQIFDIASTDIFAEIDQLLHMIKTVNANNDNDAPQEDGNEQEEVKEEVEITATPTQDVQFKEASRIWNDAAIGIEICMGILISIFENDDEKDEWGDEDGGDEYNEEEVDPNKAKAYTPSNTIFLETMNVEDRFKIMKLIGDKIKHLPVDASKTLSDYNLRQIIDQCHSLINFGFSCLLNICQNIEYMSSNSTEKPINQAADDIFKLCWDELKFYLENVYHFASAGQGTTDKEDAIEIHFDKQVVIEILKVLIFLIQKVSNLDLTKYVSVNEFLKVNSGVFDALPIEAKTMLIEMLGVRGHPKFQITKEENGAIADHFIVLLKSNEVMIIGETLNALFDVYSNEDYDDVFVQKGMTGILTYGYEVFKNKINENKNILSREDIGLLKNHLMNLKRFIQYKKENIPQQ